MRLRQSAVWRREAFVAFWSAHTVSQAGSQITILAFPLVAALTLKATPFDMGLLVAAERLPYFLISLFAGVWVDRVRRRPLLIAADLGRAALLLLVPLAAWTGHLAMPLLYAVALLTGALSVLFEVASGSYLPTLLEDEELIAGNSRLEGSRAVAEAVGPGAGGWLVAAVTAPAALLVDAASFIASAFFLSRIRAEEPPPAPAARRASVWREIGEGLRFVGGNAVLRALTAVLALSNIATAVLLAVLVLYATRTLGLGPVLLGLAFAVGSLGSLLGALSAERIAERAGVGRAIVAGLATALPGVGLIALANGSARQAAVALALGLFVSSAGASVFFITAATLRQRITPNRLRGRMTASVRFITWGLPPFAAVAGGALGGAAGLRATAAAALGLDALALATALLSPLRAIQAAAPVVDAASSFVEPARPATEAA